jgi:hypothetical protein
MKRAEEMLKLIKLNKETRASLLKARVLLALSGCAPRIHSSPHLRLSHPINQRAVFMGVGHRLVGPFQ